MLRVAEYHAFTDTGQQRRHNEDAYYARAPVFAVADGMGGAQAGEVASHAAVEAVAAGLPEDGTPEDRLQPPYTVAVPLLGARQLGQTPRGHVEPRRIDRRANRYRACCADA